MSRKSTNSKANGPKAEPIAAKPVEAQVGVVALKPMASAKQLARLLGCKPRTVHEWRRLGTIPYYRIGRIIAFDWDEVRAHLAKTCHVPATNLPQQENQP